MAHARATARHATPSAAMDLRAAYRAAAPAPEWPLGSPAQVAVALFDLAQWQPWLPEARSLLSDADINRAERRHAVEDREHLLMTYALHRLFLGARMAVDAVVVPLARDALGCPRLSDAGLHTSLSHAGRWVACAATAVGPVGVDVEQVSRAWVMPEIAERVCHPSEATAVARLPAAARDLALLALWVRKEALLKAAGVGMAREMHTFVAPDGQEQLLSPDLDDSPAALVRMLDAGPELLAALAMPPGSSVETAWLHPPRGP